MNVVTPKFGMGASVLRVEDHAFITGQGRYTDDIAPAGLLHGYRAALAGRQGQLSPRLDRSGKAAPGVHLVLTGADLAHLGDLRSGAMQKQPDGTRAPTRDIPILCRDRVAHVGDAVAFIVADTPRAGAGRGRADRGRLRSGGCRDRHRDRARRRHAAGVARARLATAPSSTSSGDKDKTEAAFARAAKVVGVEFLNNRLVCNYMEPRAAIGEWKPDEDRFVLIDRLAGRARHARHHRRQGLQASRRRSCASSPPMSAAASGRRCSSIANIRWCWRPPSASAGRSNGPATAPSISWPTRKAATTIVEAEMALDGDGRFLGLQDRSHRQSRRLYFAVRPVHPLCRRHHVDRRLRHPGARRRDQRRLHQHLPGRCLSRRRAARGRAPAREAGRRMRRATSACGRDEIRRRNFIRPEQFPYRTATGRLYDVGEFDGHMTLAMERAGWASFDERLRAVEGRRQDPRHRHGDLYRGLRLRRAPSRPSSS